MKPLSHPRFWRGVWRVLLVVLAFRTLQASYTWDAPWFAASCVLWCLIGYAYGRFHEHYEWIRNPKDAEREGASWRTQWSKLDGGA